MAKTTLRAAAKTDNGRVRDHNEDTVALGEPKDEAEARSKGYLLLVADGMGGHAAGEVASKLAAETILEEYYRESSSNVRECLDRAFKIANERIFLQGEERHGQAGMGTTCAVVVVRGDIAEIAHVGDSRVYLIREGKIRQLTEDHSWVQEQVRAHILDPQEAKNHPMRNIITRALGNALEVAVEYSSLALKNGDSLLLCSDGLSSMVDDDQIKRTVIDEPDLEHACGSLIAAANENGGADNISVVLARVEQEESPEDTMPMLVAPPMTSSPDEKLEHTAPMDIGGIAAGVRSADEASGTIAEGTSEDAKCVVPAVRDMKEASAIPSGGKAPLIKPLVQPEQHRPAASALPMKKPRGTRLSWVAFFAVLLGIVLISLIAGGIILYRGTGPNKGNVAPPQATVGQAGIAPPTLPSGILPSASAPAIATSTAGQSGGSAAPPETPVAGPPSPRSSVIGPRMATALADITLYAEPNLSSPIVTSSIKKGDRLLLVDSAAGETVRDYLGSNQTPTGAKWFIVTTTVNLVPVRGWVPAHWVLEERD